MATSSFRGGARLGGLLLLLAAVVTCAAGAKVAEIASLQPPKVVSDMDERIPHSWPCT